MHVHQSPCQAQVEKRKEPSLALLASMGHQTSVTVSTRIHILNHHPAWHGRTPRTSGPPPARLYSYHLHDHENKAQKVPQQRNHCLNGRITADVPPSCSGQTLLLAERAYPAPSACHAWSMNDHLRKDASPCSSGASAQAPHSDQQ